MRFIVGDYAEDNRKAADILLVAILIIIGLIIGMVLALSVITNMTELMIQPDPSNYNSLNE
jgi:ABC-type lipoprotein release transport system permease subunit